MNFTINIIHLAQSGACQSPNPLQWTIILVTLSPILVILGVSGTGIVAAVASTLVPMIVAGASFDAMAPVIAPLITPIATVTGSLELVAMLVNAVKGILGC